MSDTPPSADYTGHRVLKAFGTEFYSGHVQSSYYEAERKIWTVIYEDGDDEGYYTDGLLKIILPAGLVDLHLSAAWHPLKSKYDLISAYLRLGHPVDKFLSQDILQKLFNCKMLTAVRNLNSGLKKLLRLIHPDKLGGQSLRVQFVAARVSEF
jgi:hypothetical protein